jgi:hypothetical protein
VPGIKPVRVTVCVVDKALITGDSEPYVLVVP